MDKNIYILQTGLMIDTVPTLLLWIVAVTLPSLVSVSDKIIGFWTKTGENRSRMIKVSLTQILQF